MLENFQQTVDLKDRLKEPINGRTDKENIKIPPISTPVSKTERIEKMYVSDYDVTKEMHKIFRPNSFQVNEKIIKIIFIAAAVLLLGALTWWLFPNHKNVRQTTNTASVAAKWYAVKLTNNEVYYGQTADIKSDPVVLSKVYYNYDQANGKQPNADKATLRLVKKGKESYGPSGTMDIVRSQVLFFDELREDSKVLKAISEYEGSGK